MPESSPHLPGRLGNPNLTLATDPRLDPRLAEVFAGLQDVLDDSPVGPDSSYEEILEFIDKTEAELGPVWDAMVEGLPEIPNVARRTEVIRGVDGNEISLFIHEPKDRSGPSPMIVHTHGGGMALCAAADSLFVRWRDEMAALGLSVVGVEFRNAAGALGPHPFPAGLNDCASAAQWTYANRESLGIGKIVISGESGGGNLCLATALKAKQEGWLDQIDGVYSMCPYIAGTYYPIPPELVSWRENGGYQLDSKSSQAMASVYDPSGKNATNPLAWPYHATVEDLKGLPPHTISVNELDPLRDEGLIYARKLMAAGVSTISRTVNATYHGADTGDLRTIRDVCLSTLRDIQAFAASL